MKKLQSTGQPKVLTRIRWLQHVHLMPASILVTISTIDANLLLITAKVPLQSFYHAKNVPVKYYPRRSTCLRFLFRGLYKLMAY